MYGKNINYDTPMNVLGIESTCDETACSIVKEGKIILSNIVSSQIDLHREFGGVVPELACRRHVDVILPVIDEALAQAGISSSEVDLIAVANEPGLIGAILIGLNTAKALSLAWNKPLIGVNHVEAHLYAAFMEQRTIPFPCLGVVISGGHTSLVKINSLGNYQIIGQTVDDAIGEAFDKVAKLMGLPYPGGPIIELLARLGDSERYPLKSGKIKGKPYDFSFSGLKTGVLYTIRDIPGVDGSDLTEEEKQNIAASFQKTAFNDILEKASKASEEFGCQSMIFGGGVSNNKRLREMAHQKIGNIPIYWPSAGLSLDNAAMIAGLGYHKYLEKGFGDPLTLEALTRSFF